MPGRVGDQIIGPDRPVSAPSRRSGGRSSRHASRKAPLPRSVVEPGQKGGHYAPLSEHDLRRIHETALDVLERIGMGEPIPATRDRALARGCTLTEAGRLLIPRALVEDAIAATPRRFPLYGRDPAFDCQLGGDRVHFCTAGEAVRIVDYTTGDYRPSTITDVYDLYRLADTLEHIHNVGQQVIATEIAPRDAHDLSVAYAGLAGTKKPFGLSTATVGNVDKLVALADIVLGREGAFLERPCFVIGHCPIVSPLRYGKETSEVAVRCAELGLVSDMCVAPLAGATAPAALAGALVQAVAETLGGLVQVHLVRPDAKMHFGNWVFVADLRTGSFSGGSGESAVLMAAAAQLARFYDLPGSVAAGMTDSKALDYQAGFEKGVTVTLAGHAGGAMISEAAGMMASLMGVSFEGMVMDNDMIGMIQRSMRGIEVTDATLSYEVIEDVVMRGPQHYLGHRQTLELMQSEYLYPTVANRMSLSEWEAAGRPGILGPARERALSLLRSHYPSYITPAQDEEIRKRFPIRLERSAMRPGPDRW